jgi:hypothetical protein
MMHGPPLRLDLLSDADDPVYRDAVLVSLLDVDHPRVPVDEDFIRALWHLRGHGLVEWNENEGHPISLLTDEGRVLAEKLARG